MWEEACTYQCPLCEKKSDNLAFIRHCMVTEHGATGDRLRDILSRVPVTRVQHSCGLCGKMVTRSKDALSAHLREAHGGTRLPEYVNRWVLAKRRGGRDIGNEAVRHVGRS